MMNLFIKVTDKLTLGAGSVRYSEDHVYIEPPETLLLDQFIAFLDTQPYHPNKVGSCYKALGIGMAALCFRYGSYLCTLMDENASHQLAFTRNPDAAQPLQVSAITNAEMRRINIETSSNIARLVAFRQERGQGKFEQLLEQAYSYLPRQGHTLDSLKRNKNLEKELMTHLLSSAVICHIKDDPEAQVALWGDTREITITEVLENEAARTLANILTVHLVRNTYLEELHAGHPPSDVRIPHQLRFTSQAISTLMREIEANMAMLIWNWNIFFDPGADFSSLSPLPQPLLGYPHTATS